MADNEKTSPEVAEVAAKGLRYPESLTHDQIQSVCASALTQMADEEGAKNKGFVEIENFDGSISRHQCEPCPFCSCAEVNFISNAYGPVRMCCSECKIQTGWGDTGEEALSKWNDRK